MKSTKLFLLTAILFCAAEGKKKAKIGQFPFVVSITQGSSHMCAGLIYNSKWILTTGSCVEGKPAETLKIDVGKLDLGGVGNRYVQTIGVLRTFISDEDPYASSSLIYKVFSKVFGMLMGLFKTKTIPNNLAFLQLYEEISFGRDYQNNTWIPDPTGFINNYIKLGSVDLSASSNGTVMGWGINVMAEWERMNTGMGLSYISVEIRYASTCGDYGNFNQSTMICATSSLTGSENGFLSRYDLGSPLVQETPNGLVAVGVVFHPSGSTDSHNIFTRLDAFYPWYLRIAGPQI